MEVRFRASIPPIMSAISISGEQDGRLKLDVPASDIAEVIKLAAFGAGKVLSVTVSIEDEEQS